MAKLTKDFQYYKTFDILGINVDFIDMSEALSEIEKWMKTNKKYQIVTPNPEQIVLARNDYRFRKILNEAALRIPDGMGLVGAAKWLYGVSLRSAGKHAEVDTNFCSVFKSRAKNLIFLIKSKARRCKHKNTHKNCISPRASEICDFKFHRLTGTDLMLAMCKLGAQKKWRVFLLGGKDDVAKKAAEQLTIRQLADQQLTISYFGGARNIANESQKEREEAIKKINQFKPHFLFVVYGAPWQETWIHDNLPKLDVKVAMGVGGAFDYLAGMIQRAPFCIQKLGFEWFWRLVHQPWRIKRQLALGKFVWLVIKQRISGYQGYQGEG